ncbi:MAG: hypothetical protein ACI4PI_03600 [Oscillospiraceae bacterium]
MDKVDFGKPKTTASAGTYKPAEPPKEDPLEFFKREALSLLPRNVDLANKAFHELEDAQRDESTARNAFLREKKNMKNLVQSRRLLITPVWKRQKDIKLGKLVSHVSRRCRVPHFGRPPEQLAAQLKDL